MASVHEGLTMDGDTGDTSDADFAASLEAKLAGSPTVTPQATTEAPAGPPRDSQGRFVPAAPEPPQEDDGTPSPPDDIEARLREKDAFIGRQSNEIGELRKRLEALEAAKEQEPEEEYQPIFISPEQAEVVVEKAGPEGAVMAAIQDGIHPDDPAFKTIFSAAAEAVETQAELADLVELRLRYRTEVERYEAQGDEAPADDAASAWAQEQYLKQQVTTAVSELKARTPDFDDLAGYFDKALEVSPLLVPEIQSGDPDRVIPALGTLLHVARGVKVASGDATAGAAQSAADQAVAMRQAAQVASGSLRPVAPEGAPADTSQADAIKAFKEAFRATVTPTIQDGLSLAGE